MGFTVYPAEQAFFQNERLFNDGLEYERLFNDRLGRYFESK